MKDVTLALATETGSGGGSFGRTSAYPGIFPTQSGIWSYGAQVAEPVFTGGALRGNLHLAESEHSQALISYQQTIQRAFGDISDALIGYDKFHQVRVRQQDTVADLQETVRISTLRYQGGTTTYLEVLDSQRSLYAAALTLASARGNEFRSLVQLYRGAYGQPNVAWGDYFRFVSYTAKLNWFLPAAMIPAVSGERHGG